MNPKVLTPENFNQEEAFFRNISDSLMGSNGDEYRSSVQRGRSRYRRLNKKVLAGLVAAAIVCGFLFMN